MNKDSATVLVTGGAGYIGSHTVLLLLEAGYQVVVLDNLSNGSAESLERVKELTGKELVFIEGDIRDRGGAGRPFFPVPRGGRYSLRWAQGGRRVSS